MSRIPAIGAVPDLDRVTARSPAALEGLPGLTRALSGGTPGRRLGEQIALTVAGRL